MPLVPDTSSRKELPYAILCHCAAASLLTQEVPSLCGRGRQVPVQMELGGKDACIVCEDADLDLAAANIVKGGFSYSGQRCTAVKLASDPATRPFSCLTEAQHALHCSGERARHTGHVSRFGRFGTRTERTLALARQDCSIVRLFANTSFLQVLVMESVADELVAKVKAGVDKLSVGRPEVRSPNTAPFADCYHVNACGFCS